MKYYDGKDLVMYCSKCNALLEENAIFCPSCGTQLVKNNNNITSKYNYSTNDDNTLTIAILLIVVGIPLLWIIGTAILNSENPEYNLFVFIEFILFIVALIFCKKIKNIVLKIARWSLDFSTTFDTLLGVSILIIGIFICKNLDINYGWFILGAILYSLIALIKDYALYLLVDIRDSLKILADNKEEEKNASSGSKGAKN